MDQHLMRLLMQVSLHKILNINLKDCKSSNDLLSEWLCDIFRSQSEPAIVIERKGYLIPDAEKKELNDPDFYVPFCWVEIYENASAAHKEMGPSLYIYPGVGSHQYLRSEKLDEITSKPYHFITDWEIDNLDRREWEENESFARLRHPLKEGRQETHPLTDIKQIEALASAYHELSAQHYLLFACSVAYGIPVNKLIDYTKSNLIFELALGNKKNVLSQLFPVESLVSMLNGIGFEDDDLVFVVKTRRGERRKISRVKAFKWLAQGVEKVKGVDQVSATTLEKTYEYFKSRQEKDSADDEVKDNFGGLNGRQ